jgi:hypothetical protein
MKILISLALSFAILVAPLTSQAQTRATVSAADIRVSNLLYKYHGNPTVYAGIYCRYTIPSWELLINHFPYKPIIVTVEDSFQVPECEGFNHYSRPEGGTVFKQNNNPKIGVIIEGERAGTSTVYYFPSMEDFYSKGYELKHIQVFKEHINLNDLAVTQQFIRSSGTPVKYANSPVIYQVVENRQIRPFTSYEMFLSMYGSVDRVVTLPNHETYPVEGRVFYGMNVVKGSGPKVYLDIMNQLRPFSSLEVFYRHGLLLSDIVTMPDGEIGAANIGDPLY